MAAIRKMAQPYEAGFGYPPGRWEINLPEADIPTTIEGFPTREAAEDYLKWLRVELSRTDHSTYGTRDQRLKVRGK